MKHWGGARPCAVCDTRWRHFTKTGASPTGVLGSGVEGGRPLLSLRQGTCPVGHGGPRCPSVSHLSSSVRCGRDPGEEVRGGGLLHRPPPGLVPAGPRGRCAAAAGLGPGRRAPRCPRCAHASATLRLQDALLVPFGLLASPRCLKHKSTQQPHGGSEDLSGRPRSDSAGRGLCTSAQHFRGAGSWWLCFRAAGAVPAAVAAAGAVPMRWGLKVAPVGRTEGEVPTETTPHPSMHGARVRGAAPPRASRAMPRAASGPRGSRPHLPQSRVLKEESGGTEVAAVRPQ